MIIIIIIMIIIIIIITHYSLSFVKHERRMRITRPQAKWFLLFSSVLQTLGNNENDEEVGRILFIVLEYL